MTGPVRIFLLVWLAMVGGCIGSFLNVVVYRLPRRRSLVYPGSACPVCGHAIRWYHNIPVFGWLALRGRCYDCQNPISIRYPLIEALVAALFVFLALAGPFASGLTGEEAQQLPAAKEWRHFAYLAFFLSLMLALWLIELDGNPDGTADYPVALLAIGLVVGLAAPLVEPLLGLAQGRQAGVSLSAFLDTAVGTSFGLALGLASRPAADLGPFGPRGRLFTFGNFLLAGAYLGWLPAAILGATSALVSLRILPSRRRLRRGLRVPYTVALFPTAALLVVVYYPPFRTLPWLRRDSLPSLVFLVAGSLAVVSLSALWIRRKHTLLTGD